MVLCERCLCSCRPLRPELQLTHTNRGQPRILLCLSPLVSERRQFHIDSSNLWIRRGEWYALSFQWDAKTQVVPRGWPINGWQRPWKVGDHTLMWFLGCTEVLTHTPSHALNATEHTHIHLVMNGCQAIQPVYARVIKPCLIGLSITKFYRPVCGPLFQSRPDQSAFRTFEYCTTTKQL